MQPAIDRGDWRIQRVIEVSQAVDQIACPGELVASFWPGDIFQTDADPLPGLENPFALPISEELTSQQAGRGTTSFRRPKLKAISPAHRPRVVVVLRNQILSAVTAERAQENATGLSPTRFRSSLNDHGYKLVRSIGGISIYDCCAKQ